MASTKKNAPGAWNLFLSHVQREAGTEAVMLASAFGNDRVWLDRFMEDKSAAAMKEGVEHSDVFVCILSDSYFASHYCCSELRWAFDANKPVISVYKNGTNVGALLRTAPEDVREKITAIDAIALNASDADYFRTGVAKVTRRLQSVAALSSLPPAPPESGRGGAFRPTPPKPAPRPSSPPSSKPSSTVKERIEVVATAYGHDITGKRSHLVVEDLLRSVAGSAAVRETPGLLGRLERVERELRL